MMPISPAKTKILFSSFVEMGRVLREGLARQPPASDAQRPECLARERLVGLEYGGAPIRGERPSLLADQFPCAPRQQHVGGTLGEHYGAVLLLSITMHRAHQLAFGRERHFADTWEPLVKRVRTEAALARCDQQRALRWIALHGPLAGRLLNRGVVRAIGGCKRAFHFDPQRSVEWAVFVGVSGTMRCIA